MSAAAFDATGFGTLLEIEGTVATRPTVRTRPVGEQGEPMPVLCLVLNGIGQAAQRRFTCDQIFPIGQHAAAHARAAQLKQGTHVKVQVALDVMETHFPVTAHINAVPTKTQSATQEAHHA